MRFRDLEHKEDVKPEGFDLVVTHRDERTGRIVRHDPYTLRMVGQSGSSEKMSLFERPPGSGNLFDPKGKPAGRWDKSKKEGERYLADAEHVAYEIPLSEDQKIARENAALKAELAALKAEAAAKDTKKNGKGA